jgi:hypothetical protein
VGFANQGAKVKTLKTSFLNANSALKSQSGRIGYILLWALGVPIPVLFLIYLLRGCT